MVDTCEEWMKKHQEVEVAYRSPQAVWFAPKALRELMEPQGLRGGKFLPTSYPVMCHCAYSKKRRTLKLVMEVGPVQNHEFRCQLLDAVKRAGLEFWEDLAYKEDSKYTRIKVVTKKLRLSEHEEPDDSPEYLTKLLEGMWSKFSEPLNGLTAELARIDWGKNERR